MSRTDIHRPVKVMMNDPYVRHWFTDFHNHEYEECDLEEFLVSKIWIRTRCYRQVWTQCPNICGCNLCTGRMWIKRQKRAERRNSNMLCREITKYTNFEDVDFPPIRIECY